MIGHPRRAILSALAPLAATLLPWASPAFALPVNPVITAGQGAATFNTSGSSLTVNQTSNRAVINWNTFNIANGEQVTFAQPAKSSIAFNVVPATAGITNIAGGLSANGGVWLFSPAGIIFSSTARVNTGSFLASTGIFNSTSISQALGTSNQIHIFPQATPGQGAITVNSGAQINAAAGFVLLHAPTIDQDGAVTATDAVVYNADEDVTVEFAPATDSSSVSLVDEFSDSGTPSASLINHTGSTTAGTWFEADAANDVTLPGAGIINLTGHISASGMKANPGTQNGIGDGFSVILDANMGGGTGTPVDTIDGTGGTITAASGLDASAATIITGAWTNTAGPLQVQASGTIGDNTTGAIINGPLVSHGSIYVAGYNVAVNTNVTADGSAQLLAGTMQIGAGDTIQAGAATPGSTLAITTLSDLDAAPNSTLLVGPGFATPNGTLTVSVGAPVTPLTSPQINSINPALGGDLTLGFAFAGTMSLSATGVNGVGGAINVPATVGLTSVSGTSLDASGPVNVDGGINSGGSIFIATSQLNLGDSFGIAAGSLGTAPIDAITARTGAVNVTVQNSTTSGLVPVVQAPGAGDVVIGAPIAWSSANELTLDAYHSIIVSGAITASNDNAVVSLITNDGGTGGDYAFVNGGSLSFTGAPDSGQQLLINSQPYTLIFNQADLLNINNDLGNFYALATPLDFAPTSSDGYSATATVFTAAPIASLASQPFTGTFTGLGNTISNLTIADTLPIAQTAGPGYATNGQVGLFGTVGAGGVVRDANISNANVSGVDGMQVGALVGGLYGVVEDSSSSGAVQVGNGVSISAGYAHAEAGGLVGGNVGTIVNSQSSADVSAGDGFAGGLVGVAAAGGGISGSSASGNVSVAGFSGVTGDDAPEAGGLVGLVFGFQFDGTVAPVNIAGSFATGSVGGGGGTFVGGFAGAIDQSQVTTSYATGSVSQTASPTTVGANNFAGGFAGAAVNSSTVTQSYASGAVTTVSGGTAGGPYALAGGFVGDMDGGSTISQAYALGAVTVTGGAANDAGGFVGVILGGSSADHVYATGHVSGTGAQAGLVGVLGDTTNLTHTAGFVSNSYWDSASTGRINGVNIVALTGSTATNVNSVSGAGAYATASYGNFDLANVWYMIPGDTRPILRSEYSTTITDAHQLQLMAMNLGASYTLANDIDASETASAAGVWNPASGFSPVGGNGAASFTGSFDGQGHAISNLSITFTTADPQTPIPGLATDGVVGLFGFVDTTGVLQNVNIANAHVTGGDGMVVGILAGGVLGAVENAASSGVVTVGNEINTGGGITADAGGLVGGLAGSLSNSHSSATVTGGDAFGGGLVGTGGDGGSITNSYATGNVAVTSYTAGGVDSPNAGGLIGELGTGGVLGSYSTGSVTGGAGAAIGGLIGSLGDGFASTSYATGNVIQTAGGVAGSNSAAGGFVGSANSSVITQSYASGNVSSVAAVATSTFTHAGGFAGDVSNSDASISEAYALGAVTITGAGAGTNRAGGFAGAVYHEATVDDVYATGLVTGTAGVGTAAGLVAQVGSSDPGPVFSGGTVSNSYWDEGTTGQTAGANLQSPLATKTNVIGIGGSTGLDRYATTTYANFDLANTWYMIPGETRPILRSEYSTNITDAHQLQLMDLNLGAQYTLANNIDASETTKASGAWNPLNGFVPVGAAATAPFTGQFNGQGHTISNLTIVDTTPVQQTGPSGEESFGAVGLFGFVASSGLVENANLASAAVTGGDGMEAGTVAGDVAGMVTNASASGTVTVGNLADVSDARAGGLVGDLTGQIQNSNSSATVTGGDADLGGLVGKSEGGTVTASFATGAVDGGSFSGGLIGFGDAVTIDTSYATGAVTQTTAGSNFAGGFAGDLEFSTVSRSFATGNVSTLGDSGNSAQAGGFVGNLLSTTVNDAYATGSVAASGALDVVGGFAGTVGLSSAVTNVYATGAVSASGGGTVGGLVGLVSDAPQPDLSEGNEPSVTNGYWDEGTTGQAIGYNTVGSPLITNVTGIGGSTGIDPADPATYAGFAFTSTWSMPSGGFYPQLYSVSHVLNITAQNATFAYGTFPIYTLTVTGLQGGDTFASAVHGTEVQPLGATTSVTSGYYDANVNDQADINAPYDLSISNVTASGPTGAYRIIYNDNFTTFDGSLTVTPQLVSISPVSDERSYDGDVDSSASPSVSGTVVAGDSIVGTQAFDGPDAGSHSLSVISYSVNDGNLANPGANYIVTSDSEPASGFIDPESIEIDATSDTKQYDGGTVSNQVPTVASGQLFGGDTITGLTQAFDSKDVLGADQSTLSVTGYTLSAPGNYDIITVGAAGTITPAPLVLNATSDTKQYDGGTSSVGTPTFDPTQVLGTDSVTGLTQVFQSKDVLGAGGSMLLVNGYTINDGNSGNDYAVSTITASGTITPAPLVLSATSDTKQYDGGTSSSATPTADALFSGDTLTATQSFQSKDVLGPSASLLAIDPGYTINDGNGGADYTITQIINAAGTITPAPLVLSATSDSKQYDGGTSSSATPTADALFSGDTLTATQSFQSKDVLGAGNSVLAIDPGYTINDGNGGADYSITQVNTASGTITPAPLTLNAVTDSKQYDGGTSSVGTPTFDPTQVLGTDSVTGLTQVFQSKDVLGAGGSMLLVNGYTINDGNSGNDYAVSTITASGTITPAPLTLNAITDTKQYDGGTSSVGTPTFDPTQVLGTDSVTGLTQVFQSKDVLGAGGSMLLVNGYTINDGNSGNDYAVSTITASGTITPAPLVLSATSDTKQYDGGTSSSATPTADALFSGDTLTATQSFQSKDVLGPSASPLAIDPGYTINDGNGGADYTITQIINAAGTITPLALTASLIGTVQKAYDGTTPATLSGPTPGNPTGNYSLTGVIGGDTVSLNDPTSGTYDNPNAGTGKTVTVTGLQLSGADAADYTVNGTAADASGIITPAALTLSAVTQTKTYDGGVNSSGAPTNSPLIGGDSVTNLTQSFQSRNVLGAGQSTLLVTDFTINDGNGGQNYTVTLVNAPGTINPAPLTLAAVGATKTYDGTTTSTVLPNAAGLVSGDSVTATESYDSKNAGARALAVAGYTINDGNNGANYVVTTTTATGTIDPKALTAALVGSVNKTYDGNNSATLVSTNYSLSGVVTGDNVSLNDPVAGTYDNANGGLHKLVSVTGLVLSGADAANYTVNGAAAATIGSITGTSQPIVFVAPPTELLQLAAQIQAVTAGAFATTNNNSVTVVNVFPVAPTDDKAAQGDNTPVAGAGNRDLWTTSDDNDQPCPPNTTCPANAGGHP